jgi:murein DD-endopeptidase MepM/ murein hydrolase activator NlpD
MDDNYREQGYGQTRYAGVRAAREQRRTTREPPGRDISPWEENGEEERPRGSFGRVMLTQAIVCALLVGGVFLCQKAMPNTYRQVHAAYTRIMKIDMSAREVWAEIKAVFAQLREDMYVIAPYQEAGDREQESEDERREAGKEEQAPMGSGGLDVTMEYAAKSCAIAPLRTTARPVRPVAEGIITSAFGYRIHPITGAEGVHTGLDIGAPEGDPVYAAFYGTVAETGEGEEYGKYVLLAHGGGLRTLYAHCSAILAQEGMVLRPGEVIARVGSTGNSTGPHLHFEVRLGSLRCDPAPPFGKEIHPTREEDKSRE